MTAVKVMYSTGIKVFNTIVVSFCVFVGSYGAYGCFDCCFSSLIIFFEENLFGVVFCWDFRMSIESIPKDLRNLRACLLCSMVKSFDQFEQDGCDNCERYLSMKHDRDKVYECTSSNFDGILSMMQPEDSWVAKWQKIQRKAKGIYAISVSGELSDMIVRDLKDLGISYRPSMRDMTAK